MSRTAAVALIGVVALASVAFVETRQAQAAATSLLMACWLFAGLGFGALALLLVHDLTGGHWGRPLRPALQATAATLPLTTVATLLWLPALGALYPWAAAADHPQSWYLNAPFFIARTLLFLSSWSALALWVQRPPPLRRRGPVLALLWLGLSGSLAGIDWAMSLTPEHHAAGFGLLTISGWVLGAMALAIGVSATSIENASIRADHGASLLMLLLLWAYLAYMDYLTAWIGDQASSLAWYWPRVSTGWARWALAGVALRVLLPFCLLLDSRARRNPRVLALCAALLLAAQFIEAVLMILPSLRTSGPLWHWSDLLAVLGLGLLFGSVFEFLRRRRTSIDGAPA